MNDGLMAVMQIRIESQDRQLKEALADNAKLRAALADIADHPAFDREYISKELGAKLDAARAVLEETK